VVLPQNHSDGFSSIWASKPTATVYQWVDIKTTGTIFSSLASKSVAAVFSGLASKPVAAVFSGLSSKLMATVSVGLVLNHATTVSAGLTSKPEVTVFWFGPQNRWFQFGDLDLKITMTISWFGHQNQAGFGLSVTPQNRLREVGAEHASRFSGLFHVEASRSRVSQSGLKTNGGATAGGAYDTIMEVTSESN
jgi:hypothetical protein